MLDFKSYLNKTGEIGVIEEILPSIVYASGLPRLKPLELVVFENGEVGQTLSISQNRVEILILSHLPLKVGQKIARTNEVLSIKLSNEILGSVVDALGNPISGKKLTNTIEKRIDISPPPLSDRKIITDPIETGVPLVDLIIPIGRGQRELIIGDRKTGKTHFFIKTIINQALKGNICIYASVGKKIVEIKEIINALDKSGASKNTIVVATSASDTAGMIFLTPYTAVAIAEYFASQNKDVIVILDDLTNHAMAYREISLLAGRFPGRNAYPGDIFYIHSRLLERCGSFRKGSITCFPVAESIMGDMSGFIQTNLMSITDGHIFFDTELANLGRYPAINPFLSVTRVGQQAQTSLMRDLSHQLSSFLISLERLREFEHFGAELSEDIIQKLALGDRIFNFFEQPTYVVPLNVSILIIAMLWTGSWRNQEPKVIKSKFTNMIKDYSSDASFRKNVDGVIAKYGSFNELLNALREDNYGQEKYY